MDKRTNRIKFIKVILENLNVVEDFDFFDELEEAFGRDISGNRVFVHGNQKRSNPVAATSTGAGKVSPVYPPKSDSNTNAAKGTRTVSPKVGSGADSATTSTTNTGHSRTIPIQKTSTDSSPTPPPPVPPPPPPAPPPPPRPRPPRPSTTSAKKGIGVSGDNNKLKNTVGTIGSINTGGGNYHQGDIVTNVYGGGGSSVDVSSPEQANFAGSFAKAGQSNIRGSSSTFTFSQKKQPPLIGNMYEEKVNRIKFVRHIMEKKNARRYSR
jgi:hypothetical protein